MATKLLPVTLPTSVYRKLELSACKEDRHPIGQAVHLIKRGLEATEPDQSKTAESNGG